MCVILSLSWKCPRRFCALENSAQPIGSHLIETVQWIHTSRAKEGHFHGKLKTHSQDHLTTHWKLNSCNSFFFKLQSPYFDCICRIGAALPESNPDLEESVISLHVSVHACMHVAQQNWTFDHSPFAALGTQCTGRPVPCRHHRHSELDTSLPAVTARMVFTIYPVMTVSQVSYAHFEICYALCVVHISKKAHNLLMTCDIHGRHAKYNHHQDSFHIIKILWCCMIGQHAHSWLVVRSLVKPREYWRVAALLQCIHGDWGMVSSLEEEWTLRFGLERVQLRMQRVTAIV